VRQTRDELTELISRCSASIKRLRWIVAFAIAVALLVDGLSTVLERSTPISRAIGGISVLVILGALFLIGILMWTRARFIRML
jgi:hypothetical protein